MELIHSGRAVDAQEAYLMGRVVATDMAREEAEALALEIAQFPEH